MLKFIKSRHLITPYLVEGARTAGIMATGDVLAQTMVEKKKFNELDYKRAAKFGALGFVFVGPVLKYWFSFLDRKVSKDQTLFRRSMKKMLLDQSLMAPTVNLVVTLYVDMINGKSVENMKESLKVQYPSIMKRCYMLWPAVQMINFSFVPRNYQVVFTQVVAVAWNCFLSQLLNAEKQQ